MRFLLAIISIIESTTPWRSTKWSTRLLASCCLKSEYKLLDLKRDSPGVIWRIVSPLEGINWLTMSNWIILYTRKWVLFSNLIVRNDYVWYLKWKKKGEKYIKIQISLMQSNWTRDLMSQHKNYVNRIIIILEININFFKDFDN